MQTLSDCMISVVRRIQRVVNYIEKRNQSQMKIVNI